MKLVAVDPGGTTGYAIYQDDVPVEFGEVLFADIWEWLSTIDADIFVVEDYIIRPGNMQRGGYTHQWNKGEALQIIGAIKYWCFQHRKEIVLQQPTIKPAGYGFIKMKYVKGKPKMHVYDALAHGKFYLVKNGLGIPVK